MGKHSAIGGPIAMHDQRRVLRSLIYDNSMLMLSFSLDRRESVYMSKSRNGHQRLAYPSQSINDGKEFVLVANIDSTTSNIVWYKFHKKGNF